MKYFFDPRTILNKCNNNCPLKKRQNETFVPFEYHTDYDAIFKTNIRLDLNRELNKIKVLFTGEAAGQKEYEYNQPFYPNAPSGRILRQAIIDLGIKEYAIANIVCCRPIMWVPSKGNTIPPTKKNRTPTEEECNYCSSHLRLFITQLHPNVTVFLLGKTPAFTVLGNIKKYIKDNNTITKLVNLPPLIYNNRKFSANFHPRFIYSNGGLKSKLYQEYLGKFRKVLNV